MSSKELVISSNRHETRLAIMEDDQLVEVYFQRSNEYSLAGSIHKGRVTRVLPGMQSAFVDLGLERDTFLYVSDFYEEHSEDIDKITGGAEERPSAPSTSPSRRESSGGGGGNRGREDRGGRRGGRDRGDRGDRGDRHRGGDRDRGHSSRYAPPAASGESVAATAPQSTYAHPAEEEIDENLLTSAPEVAGEDEIQDIDALESSGVEGDGGDVEAVDAVAEAEESDAVEGIEVGADAAGVDSTGAAPAATGPSGRDRDRGGDRDRRGRRGRRRGRGRGRGFPDSKYAAAGSEEEGSSPDSEGSDSEEASSTETPVRPVAAAAGAAPGSEEHAGNGGRRDLAPKSVDGPRRPLPAFVEQAPVDVFVLPGESLAKYRGATPPPLPVVVPPLPVVEAVRELTLAAEDPIEHPSANALPDAPLHPERLHEPVEFLSAEEVAEVLEESEKKRRSRKSRWMTRMAQTMTRMAQTRWPRS
jgi:ribonuclease E